ncbi:MAG: hypothetical protein NWF00_12110 [Candidatus Bathyarchaeota archaeon]|nr:hypothetical protein [Candidatus Bathyarchaeota archaeon]
MKKQCIFVLFASAFLISSAAGAYSVQMVKANPWMFFKTVDPLPDTTPPEITILSPKNKVDYDSGTVLFSFKVSKPVPPTDVESGVSSVFYSVDDERKTAYYCNQYSSGSPPGLPEFTYSVNLTLPKGGHYIRIDAGGVVLASRNTMYGSSNSKTVSFSTQAEPTTTPFPITDVETVTLMSPQPKNYVTNGTSIDILLTIGIRGTASWMQYSVSGRDYFAHEDITGNTTLKSIPVGNYVLILSVNNTFTTISTPFNVTNTNNETAPPSPSAPKTPPPPIKPLMVTAPQPAASTSEKTSTPAASPTPTDSPTPTQTATPTPPTSEDPPAGQSPLDQPIEIGYALLVVFSAVAATAVATALIFYFLGKSEAKEKHG